MHLVPTQLKTLSSSWTIFKRLAVTQNLPSSQEKARDKTQTAHSALMSLIMISKLSVTLHTISDSFSLDTALNKHLGEVAISMFTLTTRVWDKSKMTKHTKVLVYKATPSMVVTFGLCAWQEWKFSLMQPEHLLARQSSQQFCPQEDWDSQYVHSFKAKMLALAQTCANGWQPNLDMLCEWMKVEYLEISWTEGWLKESTL